MIETSQPLPWPGFEPGLSRPQREVLTTIRSRPFRQLQAPGLKLVSMLDLFVSLCMVSSSYIVSSWERGLERITLYWVEVFLYWSKKGTKSMDTNLLCQGHLYMPYTWLIKSANYNFTAWMLFSALVFKFHYGLCGPFPIMATTGPDICHHLKMRHWARQSWGFRLNISPRWSSG